MTSEEFRAMQRPLKAQYKANPEAAMITLEAASIAGEGITCKVTTGKAMEEAGLHPATGGDGSQVCSGDMLLEALAACAGVTLKSVATALDFDLQGARVNVEGDLDFKGTLGVDKAIPVGFQEIRLYFHLNTTESQERIDTLLKLTERYCVVLQTLSQPPDIKINYETSS